MTHARTRYRNSVPKYEVQTTNITTNSVSSFLVIVLVFFLLAFWIKYVKNSNRIANLKENRKRKRRQNKRRRRNNNNELNSQTQVDVTEEVKKNEIHIETRAENFVQVLKNVSDMERTLPSCDQQEKDFLDRKTVNAHDCKPEDPVLKAEDGFKTDCEISHGKLELTKKVFRKWEHPDLDKINDELEATFAQQTGGFSPEEMFARNPTIKSDFKSDMSQYTTKLEVNKLASEQISFAEAKAKEIMKENVTKPVESEKTAEGFRTDSEIRHGKLKSTRKQLKMWEHPELHQIDDELESNSSTGFTPEEMLARNTTIKTDFNSDMSQYTTKLDMSKISEQQVAFAEAKASEIMKENTTNSTKTVKPAYLASFKTDSEISHGKVRSAKKVFKKWEHPNLDQFDDELEKSSSKAVFTPEEMFARNPTIKTDLKIDMSQYTTKLDMTKLSKQQVVFAEAMANEIMKERIKTSKTLKPDEKCFKTDCEISCGKLDSKRKKLEQWEHPALGQIDDELERSSSSKTSFTPKEMFARNSKIKSDFKSDMSQYTTKLDKTRFCKRQVDFDEEKGRKIIKENMNKSAKKTKPDASVQKRCFKTDKEISNSGVHSKSSKRKVFKMWGNPQILASIDEKLEPKQTSSETGFSPEEMFKQNTKVKSDFRRDLSQYTTKLHMAKLTKKQIAFAREKANEITKESKQRWRKTKRAV